MLRVLAKKNTKRVLLTLQKYGELHFWALHKKLKMDRSSLSIILKELLKCGLITKKEVIDDSKKFPKSIYSLTELGQKAIKIYKDIEDLERERISSISVNNSKDVVISVGNNNIVAKNVHIKK
jgi:DNA-binding HxlR family transcriptional regulator